MTDELGPGDTLDILLFDDDEIRVTLVERMESPLGGDAFLGEVEGAEGVCNAVVLRTDEGLMVDVQDFRNSRVYTVVSDADGVTVKEIDPSVDVATPTDPVEPDIPTATKRSADGLLGASADQASTLVDVLVAYDTPAAAWARQNGGGITNFATMAVQKMNAVLANCGLSSDFRFRLVGVTTVAATGGTDFGGVLSKTRTGTGEWAPIKAKRDEVGADIVTTLIDTGSASGTTGLGNSLDSTPLSSFSEWAYNVCAIRAVAQSQTMTHEVGHNIGAGHASAVNPEEISPGPQLYDYSAGYYFTGNDGVAYHTIMAYYYDGFGNTYTPIPFFSSPDLTYAGAPIGDATHDNVRTIRQTYVAASNWRPQKIPMSYDVYFSPESGATFTDSISVTLSPGKAGLPIRYTLDGSTPTANSALYTGPIILTQTTTIRAVTVTDGVAGPVFEATYSVSDLGNGVDAPQLAWRTSESLPWVFQTTNTYDGVDAAQSTDAGAYWTSDGWLETTVTGPAYMSFRYKMRTGRGTFSVLVDGSACFEDAREDVYSDDWHLAEVPISSGQHTVRFLFENKGSRYDGFNGAWLDTVQFDALSRPPTLSPATTADEETATVFRGSVSVSLVPPDGRTGFLFYTIDGSDPTGEAGMVYDGPFELTQSTRVRAVFVEGGMEPSIEVGGLYLERHPVHPGEWTTDVTGARAAAAQDGALVAVLLANRAGCWWSQQFYPVAESPEFLSWCEANGVYLVTGDTSCHADAKTAESWFWDLCYAYTGASETSYPQMYFVLPTDLDSPIDQGLARNDNSSLVGTELYLGTVESLINGFASVLGATVPAAPVCSEAGDLVDAFPLSVTLSNPNPSGTIYYTLDGSAPTRANGILYDGPIEIASSDIELRAAVWTGATLSSPVLARKFRTVSEWANGVFGTSDITWHRSGAVDWYQVGSEPTLRTGGLLGGTAYSSTITATVSGKGRLIYRYKAASWSSQNVISHTINGVSEWTVKANYTSIPTVDVTNEVTDAGATTFCWTYTVNDPSKDYTSGYTSGGVSVWSGVWIYDLQWIPERDGVEVEGVFVSGEWFAENFPAAATDSASRTALARSDTDGDGFENWKECLCGTDPNDAEDHLRATIRMEGGEPVVGWNLTAPQEGASCIVEGSTSIPAAETDWISPPPQGATFFRVRVAKP